MTQLFSDWLGVAQGWLFETVIQPLVFQLGFGELLFLARDPRGHAFALDRVRNKNSLAIFSRDAFAAKGDILDC